MSDALIESAAVQSIVVTRLDALGDIVLGTMLLSGLRAKWPDARIRLVVRPQMEGVRAILPDWVEVIPLPFDPRQATDGRSTELAAKLKDFSGGMRPDLCVLGEFNRTWAGELLAAACGARQLIMFNGPSGLNFRHSEISHVLKIQEQVPSVRVCVEADAHECAKYREFLDQLGLRNQPFEPEVRVRGQDAVAGDAIWKQTGLCPGDAIVCFPSSGEQLVRSLDAPVWGRWIEHLQKSRPVVLMGSESDRAVLEAIRTRADVPRVMLAVEDVGIAAAFLKRAGFYIGMDTGPMHLAAVLGRPTLGIFGGGHRAERFLPVGPRAAAVRMPIGCYGCDWLCPFDRRLCIKNMPEQMLREIGDVFLASPKVDADHFAPRIFELNPAVDLPPAIVLGPIMRQHRRFLQLNHEVTEHHAYLGEVNERHRQQMEGVAAATESLARQNHERAQAVAHLSTVIANMTGHNTARDEAIAHLSGVIADMTQHNLERDKAIAHLSAVIAEMTQQNLARDAAIAHINQTLAEMTLRIKRR